jgi:hypothetical protein
MNNTRDFAESERKNWGALSEEAERQVFLRT